MKRALLLATLVLWGMAGMARAQQPRAHLYLPSSQPTAKDCDFIAQANSQEAARISRLHTRCLDEAPSSDAASYRGADPCSKLQCRPLHLQMEWARNETSEINRQCRAMVPKQSRMVEEAGTGGWSGAAKQDLIDADKMIRNVEDMVDVAKKIDRPWDLLVSKLGNKVAAKVRREVANLVSGGATRNNLDWQVYDAIVNRAIKTNAALTPTNHVRNLLNQALLSRLYAEHAMLLGELNRSFAEVDRVLSSRPAADRGRLGTFPVRSYASAPGDTAVDAGCSLFADSARSAALLEADAERWLALNARCNK